MKKIVLTAAIALAIAISCKTATSKTDTANQQSLTLDFSPKSGSKAAGTAVFTEQNGEVTFTASLTGLEPGVHAIHIHEKSDCSAPDASSAGGHWNPTFKSHGKWGSASYHRGDIGNFPVNQNGEGTITMTTSEWCIGCGDQTKDILGKSVIVHTNPDDYVTQPTGNAGGRIACSAIIR
ncbi:MAG TPA: superoxide dismutase family protein [Flavobacterium sp.]|jgi:Cu-Zn family superoxide dismutase